MSTLKNDFYTQNMEATQNQCYSVEGWILAVLILTFGPDSMLNEK